MTEILFVVEIDDESVDVTVDTPSIDIGVLESAAAIVTVEGPPGQPGQPGQPGAGGSSLPDIPATGDCWGLPGVLLSQTQGDLSLSVGGIYYAPFTINAPIVVTGARFNISEASATAANVRLGIYGASGVGPDANAPLWDSGAVSVAADFAGPKYENLSVTLPAGHYLATIATDAGIFLRTRERAGFVFLGADNQLKGMWFNIFTFGAFPTPGPAALGSLTELLVPFLLQWTNT